MKAKDTVMTDLAQAIIKHPELPMGQAIAIEQAEISFKAGKEAGVKEVIEWMGQFGGLANKIEGEDPEYGHQVQYWECRDDLSPEEYEELGTIYYFPIEIKYKEWQSKLKEWGIKE